MSQVIKNQVQTFKNSVDRVMDEHHLAMHCWEVTDLVETGLFAMDMLDRDYKNWVTAVNHGRPMGTIEAGQELAALIDELIAIRPRIARLVRKLEANGHRVERYPEFAAREFLPLNDRPFDIDFGSGLDRISHTHDPEPVEHW